MTTTPSTCPLDCPDACGVLVEADESGAFVRLRGNPAHGYTRGALCGKTAFYGELIQSPERLTTPLVRDGKKSDSELRPASWDEALERIASRVGPLLAEPGGGERILAAAYAGSMGFVARKFPMRAMHAMGATVTDGGLCDSSATVGFQTVLGRVIGPDIEDADGADLLVLWGCDVKRTHQHLQPAVQRLCKRGVPVVAIDIHRTDTLRALERWGGTGLVVNPGSDAALALAIMRLAYERGYADRDVLERECHGADEFERHVLSGHELEWAAGITGLAPERISELADLAGRAQAPFLKAGVGFARRRNGAMSMRAVCSLGAVFGHPGRVHFESSEHFDIDATCVERPDLRPAGAPKRVIRHVAMGRELDSGFFRAMFVWGHNPAVTCPDTARVQSGMARDDLFVVVHEHFLTESAQLADVVLPATTFVEHSDVYRSYGHRWLNYAHKAADGPEGPRSNVETFAAIARALGLPRETWDATPESLAEELLTSLEERVGPVDMPSVRAGEPVKLRELERDGWGTPSGRVELVSEAAAEAGQPAMATYVPDDFCGDREPFLLTSAPSVHTHNSTFSHTSRHVKRIGRPKVHMRADDAGAIGVTEGELATLSNRRGAISLTVALTEDLPRGMVRVDGVPRAADTPEGVGINVLVSNDVSDLGDGNVLYSTRVDVRPFAGER